MPRGVTFLELEKPKTVKDAVIIILSREWPLTVRKIHNRVRKMGFEVSYQAVHKVIKGFVKENVLERKNKKYRLSLRWIKDMHNIARELEARYIENETPFCGRVINSKDISFFVFESIFDLDHFNLDLLKRRKTPLVYTQSQHFWWSLFHFQEEKKPEIPQIEKIYSVCAGKTFVDRVAVELERSMKFKVKEGVKFRINHDVFVVDDKVIFMFYPKEFLEKIKVLYSKKRNILDKNFLNDFNKIFAEKRKIFVCLIKNQEFANQMRDVISDAFRQ